MAEVDNASASEQQQKSKPPTCTFYCSVICLAIISKLHGTFPLSNVIQRDGRKLKYKILCLSHVWDVVSAGVYILLYVGLSNYLMCHIKPGPSEKSLRIWLVLTYYTTLIKTVVHFFLVHFYAPRLPALFKAFEDYYQGIGKDLVKCKTNSKRDYLLSIASTIVILIVILAFSLTLYRQFDCGVTIIQAIPMCWIYMLVNAYKEIPVNMFGKLCYNLTLRLREVHHGLRELRQNNKDVASKLEKLRLQHAALVRIMGLLQNCYGMQLAVVFLFLIVEVTLQLFVFFALTWSDNLLLLVMALYYCLLCFVILFIVEKLQRTDSGILEELAQFEVNLATYEQHLQIQLFTAQLTAKPVKFSASGFVTVNNATMCSVLASVAAHLTMTIQFAPYIEMKLSNVSLYSVSDNNDFLNPRLQPLY